MHHLSLRICGGFAVSKQQRLHVAIRRDEFDKPDVRSGCEVL